MNVHVVRTHRGDLCQSDHVAHADDIPRGMNPEGRGSRVKPPAHALSPISPSSFGNVRRPLFRAMWLFALFSLAGLAIEELYHWVLYGELQNRAGLVLGPFSPIYGVGGICMALASRFAGSVSMPKLFLISAMAGGAIEYSTSLLLESLFGLKAWDYTGQWLSIDGRTSGYYLLIWGMLGVLCIKVAIPALEKSMLPQLERLPELAQKAFAAFLVFDIALTVVAFGCWQHRQSDDADDDLLQQACSMVFDDEFMSKRFETLSFIAGSEGLVR